MSGSLGTRPAAYVDRVETETFLVMGGPDLRTITVWRTSNRRTWVVTDEGDDVGQRSKPGAAVSVALRRLGVDPSNPSIEWTDER